MLAVDLDGVFGHAAGRLGLDLEQRLRLAGRAGARGAAGQGRHPLREIGREGRLQAHAHIAPGARRQDVAAAHGQRTQGLVDVARDAALRAEDLADFVAAGFHAGAAGERILFGQGLVERLVDLRVPDLVELGLRRLHGHGVRLDQRAHQKRAQRFALRRAHAGQHLLVHQLQGVGQLGILAFQRLAHQRERARAGIALVVQQVEAGADLRQRAHVVAQQRLVVARDDQARHVGELAAHRAHGDRFAIGGGRTGRRRRLAQDHAFEPADHAALRLLQPGVDQRGVVPGGLFVRGVDELGDGRGLRIAQAVHRADRLFEARERLDRDAAQELLPFLGVLRLVHRRQALLDLLGAAFQRQVVAGVHAQHPVAGLDFLLGGLADGGLDVLLPGFAREGARDGVAARYHAGVVLADDARHRHGLEPRGGAGLERCVGALAGRHALHHGAQAAAGFLDQGQVGVDLRPASVRRAADVERDQALGAADQLVARHRAAVGLQPAAPEARDLVGQVGGIDVLVIGHHQIRLERVVGVVGVGWRGVLEQRVAARGVRGAGLLRRRLRRASGGGGSGRGIHLRQEILQAGLHGRQHELAHAVVVLGQQAVLQHVALVQPQAQRPRPAGRVAVQLLDAVLQDLHRFQAALQIGALVLQAHHLVQVGLHVLRQLAVAQIGPAPAAQHQAQRQHQAEERQVAHAGLGRAGMLAHQFLVGEDHAGKQVAQEESVVRGHVARQRALRGAQVEALGQAFGGRALRYAFLQRAGEVEAAEHRLVLERIGFEKRGQERAQRGLDAGEFQREGQEAGGQFAVGPQRDLRGAHFLQPFVQLVEALIEQRQHVAVFFRAVGQGGAPHAVAFALVAVGEELAEAGDQVGLGEDDVDRREHFQPVGQFLHALAQVLGQVDREFGARARQLLDAGGHDDAVDGRLGAMALEQV